MLAALAMCLSLWWALCTAVAAQVMPLPLTIGTGERVLVIAPHPDDETLGAGGLIQRVQARGGTVRVVLVTAGDRYIEAVAPQTGALQPRPPEYIRYGERRLREAREAVQILAPDRAALQLLDVADGQLETLLRTHPSQASESRVAEAADAPVSVEPRANGAVEDSTVRSKIERVLREMRPTTVVLPDVNDRHPDHGAIGKLTLLAIADAEKAFRSRPPRVLMYLIHWPNWPPGSDAGAPRYRPDVPLLLPKDFRLAGMEPMALRLSDAEISTKKTALAKYKTQNEVAAALLAGFVRRTEPFVLVPPNEVPRLAQMIEANIGLGTR